MQAPGPSPQGFGGPARRDTPADRSVTSLQMSTGASGQHTLLEKYTPAGRVVLVLLAVTIVAVHGYYAWLRFPPGSPADQQLPFTETDHPLQFYYGQLTAQYFQNRHAFWGYDPTFMAGYGKSIIFPTSSTLPDLVAIISGPYAACGYNLISTACTFLTPVVLGLAAVSLTRSWASALLALVFGVQWTWCSWPVTYVTWGMGPFILASAASVWSAAQLVHWLDHGWIRSIVGGTMVAAIAVVLHPLSLITLALTVMPAYLVRMRHLNWRDHLATWSVPLVVAAFWSPWWIPALVLRDTYGTSAVGFVNENVRIRMDELLQFRWPEETALLLGALLVGGVLLKLDMRRGLCVTVLAAVLFIVLPSARQLHLPLSLQVTWPVVSVAAAALAVDLGVGIYRRGEAGAGFFFGGFVALFALAYFGGATELLWRLQPGRFTQPLYALLVVFVSCGIVGLLAKLRERPWKFTQYHALHCLALVALGWMLIVPRAGYFFYRIDAVRPLRADLPQEFLDLARFLKDTVDDSGRILFEDRGRLQEEELDPFGGTNPSALLPLLAPGQYIGGPYLYTNLKSNFTQFGDGKLFNRPVRFLDLATFEHYAQMYNIRWLVCWSRPMVAFADRYPDYFRAQGRFGPLRAYSLDRAPNWALTGRAHVRAQPDRLEVSDAEADSNGVLVLAYHWIDTLRSSAAIRPVLKQPDPVPFIAVDQAPSQFVIENRMW
jgi:hypothetical protein